MSPGHQSPAPVIVWFRKDLRLLDNEALAQAHTAGVPVLHLYIHDPEREVPWAPGLAVNWWLHHALKSLQEGLKARGHALLINNGPTDQVLEQLLKATRAQSVFCNENPDTLLRDKDTGLQSSLMKRGIQLKIFQRCQLLQHDSIFNKSGKPYQVFTPFYRAVRAGIRTQSHPEPDWTASIPFAWESKRVQTVSLEDLGLLPEIRWDAGFYNTWDPSIEGAHIRLKRFLNKNLAPYPTSRDRPDLDGTSCFSPYLRAGQISPAQIVEAILKRNGGSDDNAESFIRQLIWREFAIYLLVHFPWSTERALKSNWDSFPWSSDEAVLKRWQQGKTGYPIIDAGMRQLWTTGWMHNRVRMIASSFLVKQLMQPWQTGAAWFWDTLIDADLANNTMGWQWSAGSGADAAPYFRIFNPVNQGEKFDPEGSYVRQWIPELSSLPDKYLQRPWEAPEIILNRAEIRLGRDYPEPVISLQAGRIRALDAYNRWKQQN